METKLTVVGNDQTGEEIRVWTGPNVPRLEETQPEDLWDNTQDKKRYFQSGHLWLEVKQTDPHKSIDSKIIETILLVEREIAVQHELDKGRDWHSNISGQLEKELSFYKAGINREIPQSWAHLMKTVDPEYQEFIRLKEKFGGE